MIVAGIKNQYAEYYGSTSHSKTLSSSDSFMGTISAASTQVDKQAEGDVIGLKMIKKQGTNIFYGIKAIYSEKSTRENPIVNITTNYEGKKVSYNVNINEVNPNNASRLEMFALCSYADDQGLGDNSTFGTYQTLCTYVEMANHNGYISSDSDGDAWEKFENEKMSWVNMSQKVMDLLYDCNDLIQYNKGISIMNLFSLFSKEPIFI